MADSLFERREIVRVLDVPSKYVGRNIRGSLLAQISARIEGKCGVEGYIQPKSAVILDHSLGRMDMLHSGIRYRVRFHADICLPHKGQIFKAPITFRSKIGIHAELDPIRVLLPRDLHLGNTEYESIEPPDEIEFEVLGAEFKQNDDSIFVLGKFIKKAGTSAPQKTEEVEESAPLPQPTVQEGETRSVSVKAPAEGSASAAASAASAAPRRRKRLGAPSTLQVNVGGEPSTEGEAKGGAGESLSM